MGRWSRSRSRWRLCLCRDGCEEEENSRKRGDLICLSAMPCQTRPDQTSAACWRCHSPTQEKNNNNNHDHDNESEKWKMGKWEKRKRKKRKKRKKTGNWEIAPRRRCTDANFLPSRDISSFFHPFLPPPSGARPARPSECGKNPPPEHRNRF